MEERELPVRKHPRLRNYDYSQQGCYFVTICTKDRTWILSEIVGPDALIGPASFAGLNAPSGPVSVQLSEYGGIVNGIIHNTNNVYSAITVDNYVIMPNHIHMLLTIHDKNVGPMGASGPTLGTIVKAIKTLTTRQIGESIWQEKYHDHIIRNSADFEKHWHYIDNNPARWAEDELY